MTHRVEQVASTMRKALAQVLHRKISDPRIRGMVSITEIDVSPDMKTAKVFVTVLPDQYEKRTLAGLRAANRHIHGELKKLVAFRIVPHLDFQLDSSLKKASEIMDAIQEGLSRSAPAEPTDDTPKPTDEADGPDPAGDPDPRPQQQDPTLGQDRYQAGQGAQRATQKSPRRMER